MPHSRPGASLYCRNSNRAAVVHIEDRATKRSGTACMLGAFFLMPANGRPCRSTRQPATGIVSGAPKKRLGSGRDASLPSVNFIRKTEPGIAPGGTWIVTVLIVKGRRYRERVPHGRQAVGDGPGGGGHWHLDGSRRAGGGWGAGGGWRRRRRRRGRDRKMI